MPTFRNPFHRPDDATAARFSAWTDRLVDLERDAIPTPDSDFSDVAQTATTVHRAVGAGATTPFLTDRSDAIWEQIMSTTTVSPAALPGPAIDNNPTGVSAYRLSPAPRPGWSSYVLTAALIAAIVVAGFAAIWRITDPLTGNGPGTTDQPAFLAQGTPGSAGSDCDLTNDIPVVTSLDAVPWDRTVLLFSGNTLALHCNDGSTEIAEGVSAVRGTLWPGAFIATMEDGALRGINLLTGATGDFGSDSVLKETEAEFGVPLLSTWSDVPWMFVPANQDLTDWRIVDLRTMKSLVLSDEIDGVLARPWSPALPLGFNGDAAVFLFGSPPEGRPDEGVGDLPGNTLVLDGSLDNLRWTQTGGVAPPLGSLSPDGSLLALSTALDDGLMVRVTRVADGEVVAETDIDLGISDDFLLLNVGLLHLSRFQLDLLAWDDDGTIETTTLLKLDSDEGQPYLYRTADPDVVIVNLTAVIEPSAYRVNVATGDVSELPGLLAASLNPLFNDAAPPQRVLGVVPAGQSDERWIVQMIDVTTGEVVVESDPVDLVPSRVPFAATRMDGTLGFASLTEGQATVLNATTGESFQLRAPAESVSTYQHLFPSPDGTLLSGDISLIPAEERAFWIVEIAPEAEWIEIAAGEMPALIVGSHGLPDTGDDEPVTLDAQDMTPLPASPVATPAG